MTCDVVNVRDPAAQRNISKSIAPVIASDGWCGSSGCGLDAGLNYQKGFVAWVLFRGGADAENYLR